MSNLRYASCSPDRLYDSIEERYFITEKLAVEKLNVAVERAAQKVEAARAGHQHPQAIKELAVAIRALKENV